MHCTYPCLETSSDKAVKETKGPALLDPDPNGIFEPMSWKSRNRNDSKLGL